MWSISDILADPSGGSRMSGWIICALVLIAGAFGASTAVFGLMEGDDNWWMGMPLALIALPEGVKFARYWRRSNARR